MLSEWQEIAAPAEYGSCNVRIADSSHPLDFRIGRDYRGRYSFQLDADYPDGNLPPLPRMSAVTCELEPIANGRLRLIANLETSGDFRNFSLMCRSLMLATEQLVPSRSRVGLLKAIEELHRWQEMLRHRSDGLLSRSERIGLVGELLFLRDVLADRMNWIDALNCWYGQDRHEQDFVVGSCIFEVKTQIVTADRRIRISSEDQLDPGQGRILLCNQGIAPTSSVDASARTLNLLVEEIRSDVALMGPRALDLLDIALLHAGYEVRKEYGEENWLLIDRTYYEVKDDFPRIERGELRSGVDTVNYSIRISECTPFTVSETDAFAGILP